MKTPKTAAELLKVVEAFVDAFGLDDLSDFTPEQRAAVRAGREALSVPSRRWKAKIIERGNGLTLAKGAEVYVNEEGELMQIVHLGSTIHTDDPRGNYVFALLELADRALSDLSDAEFADLPQVLVALVNE